MSAGPMVQVTDIEDGPVGRASSTGFLLLINGIVFSLSMLPLIGFGVGGLLWSWGNYVVGGSLLVAGLLALGLLLIPAKTFPEWPFNRLLCGRLLREISRRRKSIVSPNDPEARILDLIPKANWQAVKLETAVDIMLVRVTRGEVLMEGDRKRYQIPAHSIVRCYVETMRPTGWMVDHFCVLLMNSRKRLTLSLRSSTSKKL